MREFEELQKEYDTAARAAGVTQRFISQVVRGAATEYTIATPISAFAVYDERNVLVEAMGEAGAAEWVARVTKCVKSRRIDTLRARSDLSIPLAEGRTSKLLVMRTVEHLPGRFPDDNSWLTEKWVPALKNAGMNGVFIARNAFGGSNRLWYRLAFVDNWAVFDGEHPVRRDIGQEAWGELLRESGAMTLAPVVKVLRLRPDLSIQP